MLLTQLLRLKDVLEVRGKSRSGHYLDIQNGTFTEGVKISASKSTGWPRYEVEFLNTAIIAGKTGKDLIKVVEKLTAKRKEVFGKSDEEIQRVLSQIVHDIEGGHE